MTARSIILAIASLTMAGAARAQVCVGYTQVSRITPTFSAGLDDAGDESAVGVALGIAGRRFFGGAFLRERGFGLGGSVFNGPSARSIATDHLVAGFSAGTALAATPSGDIALCGIAEAGMGLAYGSSPNHESHYRGAAHLALGGELPAGPLRLSPTISGGLVLVNETEYQGDIIIDGTYALFAVTIGLGVTIAHRLTIQPRVVIPLLQSYSTAFSVVLNWTVWGGR